jgi:hypothetical protein
MKKDPVGPDITNYYQSMVGCQIGQQYNIETFEPGSTPDTAVWNLKIGVPSNAYPSDNCLTRIYPSYVYTNDAGVTNHALGIWYKMDGWADQYYWWNMSLSFMAGVWDLNYGPDGSYQGSAVSFRVKAVKQPGAIAGSIRFLLTSPNAVSIADITASRENQDPLDQAETEVLKTGMIPLAWDWQTIIIPFDPDDVRGKTCSGFELSFNNAVLGEGGLVLIDDIKLIEFYEKN